MGWACNAVYMAACSELKMDQDDLVVAHNRCELVYHVVHPAISQVELLRMLQ
jgi:hypothetical protein